MLPHPIKLVIWDLDDTFWQGTLTEGGVTIDPRTIDIIITLSRRGIVSSICSKNNRPEAQRILEEYGVWSYFVFPQIEFAAKGAAIAELIERMNLRQENVLFIDDNRLNLEEARFCAPNLMTAHPDDVLPILLDLPQAAGKEDPGLTRLNQYKQLEQKANDLARTALRHEEFLRQCDVRVDIDIDVENHFDRVVELINRSNQLNFTKVRLETQAARERLRKSLRSYMTHAGVVKASDKYGNYGIIGFYLTQRNAEGYHLRHFVFSCRIMNMGIEQYVHELLGQPECPIVPPVANGLNTFAKVDWIRPPDQSNGAVTTASDAKLLLIGGCDLLQVATYCSSNRVEYVNTVISGHRVRYDDPGFILSSRDAIAASSLLPAVPCWTAEDAQRFDLDLRDSRILIVSLWEALIGDYVLLDGDILVRLAPNLLGKRFAVRQPDEFPIDRLTFIRLTTEQKLELVVRSLERLAQHTPLAEARFLLGANTRMGADECESRTAYNALAAEYCSRNGGFEYISIDETVPADEILDGTHFTRYGYFSIASKLIEKTKMAGDQTIIISRSDPTAAIAFRDVVENAEILTLSESGRVQTGITVRAARARWKAPDDPCVGGQIDQTGTG